MAGYGIASGLLSGLSGLPRGMQQADELNLQRERLGQGQQQIDLQRQILESSKFADLPPGMLPQSYGAQAGPGGNVRVPTAMLPFLGQQRAEEVKRTQAATERTGQAAAFRRAAQTTGNASLNTLADLIEAGGIKDPGTIYETELKGQQGVAEKNSSLDMLRAILGPSFALPEPMGPRGSVPAQAGQAPGIGTLTPVQQAQADQAVTPGGTNQAGAGGGPTPMPNIMSAFRPDISLKAGPATINLKTPTDERDSYASSMFNGLLYHQLRPEQQAKVLAALPQSPANRLAQAQAQGENAAGIQLKTAQQTVLPPGQAAELGVPYGTTQQGAYGRKPLPAAQQNKAAAASSAMAIIDGVQKELDTIAQPSGPLGRIYQAPQNMWGVYAQGDPKMTALNSRIQGTLSTVIRALGEVGTLSDKDIARAKQLWPVFVPIPDSAETIAEKMRGLRELIQEVGSRGGGAAAEPDAGPTPSPGPARRKKFNPGTGRLE